MGRKTIGIVGYGYVGKGIHKLFDDSFDIEIYDIVSHPDKNVLKNCDLIVVCVPTPMSEDGSCDLSFIYSAAEIIVEENKNALICIKSAVSPGTTDSLNEKYNTDRFNVSPEYMGEGLRYVAPWKYPDPVDSKSHDFVICGGPRASEVLDFFARVMAVDAKYMICSTVEAELTKRFENAFFATKVTFVNEAAKICESYGVDWKIVRELWLADSRIGRSHTSVFKDNPGYGGKCLPKDLSALIVESKINGYDPILLEGVKVANERIRGKTDKSEYGL